MLRGSGEACDGCFSRSKSSGGEGGIGQPLCPPPPPESRIDPSIRVPGGPQGPVRERTAPLFFLFFKSKSTKKAHKKWAL